MRGVRPREVQVRLCDFVREWSVRTVCVDESRSTNDTSMHLTNGEYSCDRLDKICQPTKSKRQLKSSDTVRNSRVEKSRCDDVSRLERKLDQLVAHLKPQQNLASPSSSDASTLIPSPAHVGHGRICSSMRSLVLQ